MTPITVTLTWSDGEYPFALRIGQVRELESLKAIGIGAIYQRLYAGDFYGDDAYQIIRLGLIGGGMPPVEALKKATAYVLERPLAESLPIARAILLALFHGVDAGKDQVSEAPVAAPLTE
jgi:hypothetical protein